MADFDELGYSADQLQDVKFRVPLYSPMNNRLIHKNENNEYWMNPVGNINFIGADSELLKEYRVVDGDNWPLISHKLYGNTELWWIIAELNSITDAFTQLPEPGGTLKVISVDLVWQILNDVKNNVPGKDSRLS